MRALVERLLIVGLIAALAGCVVAPVGPPRAYGGAVIVTPAPVVVHAGWGWGWRGRCG